MINPSVKVIEMKDKEPGQTRTPSGMPIPPAWTHVLVAKSASAPVQAVGIDSKGRKVYVYSPKHRTQSSSKKFKRLTAFAEALPKILNKIETDVKRNKEEALILDLIYKTGFRIGSGVDTKAAKKAYGASTLLGKHVSIHDSNLNFKFTAKKGVETEKTIHDPTLATKLATKIRHNEEPIFKVSGSEVRDYLKGINKKFVIKDFRTYRGTLTAQNMIKSMPLPKTKKEFKKNRKIVATAVASELGNTPTVALGSYIAPEVFRPWMEAIGI